MTLENQNFTLNFELKNMKVVIIEDEKPAARKLERLINNFTDLQLVCNAPFCGRRCRLVQ